MNGNVGYDIQEFCSSLSGYSRSIDDAVTKKRARGDATLYCAKKLLYFGLFYRVWFLNVLVSVLRCGVKVKGIWALYEGASRVQFAWYGRSNGGNIQRTCVYHFWKVSNRIPYHSIREHKLSYLFRIINYIFLEILWEKFWQEFYSFYRGSFAVRKL